METTIMNNMCRCCASEGAFKDIKTTYRWMGEDEVYGDMLKDCFDITLSASDSESGICEVCITQLRNAANFKKQVLHTEEQFLKHGQNKLFKPNIVKVELPVEDVLDGDDNNLSGDDAFSGAEYELPIKTEKVEEPKTKKRAAAKASTSRSKKQKTSDGEDTPAKSGQPIDSNKIKVNPARDSKKDNGRGHKLQPKVELALHRNNIKEILVCSTATPIQRYGGIGYTCAYCNKQYLNPADLRTHTTQVHNDVSQAKFMNSDNLHHYIVKLDITSLRCKLCNSNIETLDELMEHLKNIHEKKIFRNIKNRILPFKFDSETLRCAICEHVFNSFKKLMEHTSTHYRNFICSVCDAGFVNHSALKGHSLSHETGSFTCTYCPKVLSNLRQKTNHEKTHRHVDNKQYKCGYCSEAFKTSRKKEMHLTAMHGVPQVIYKCQACDKTFKIRKVFRVHIKRDHLMERSHKCTQCDKSFFRSEQLKEHMVRHTGQREFQCGVCLKKFGAKGSLRHHMRKHDKYN
ncbi:PR domain zinc finger protein 5 isoform X9 [Manduca sexta]|uniref:PR domain zinc finger protein 5 isoform X9 n=1 Tax=Manduca sexta TaxID=7130 RepID=UPI00118407D8|nr:PR domain zinc finger protein 5 isoform X9 [Manduca sexta]